MRNTFWNDEAGFVVSMELVLVATLLVLGLIVGLAEVQSAVVQELNDVGEAIGRLNQSYFFSGFASVKTFFNGGFNRGFNGSRFKAFTPGSAFIDSIDDCDLNECALGCAGATGERGKAGVTWRPGTTGGTSDACSSCATGSTCSAL